LLDHESLVRPVRHNPLNDHERGEAEEAKGVIANNVEALTRVVPPRVVALSSMGAHRTSGVGNVTALSLLEQGFRSLPSPVAFVRAAGFFENLLYGLQTAQGGTLPVFYNGTEPDG
jgi:uncharacterized protein YbjT (DUF2867 family)